MRATMYIIYCVDAQVVPLFLHNTFFDVCITRDIISASVASDVDRDGVLGNF